MCEFLSWIEKGDTIYFLVKAQVDSPQGLALKKRFPGEGELIGHAAIRAYYDIVDGVNKECTDFSTPDNFPAIIVRALKNGEFKGFPTPLGLLNRQSFQHIPEAKKANADRKKANADRDKANADWDKANADRKKPNADWNKADADWNKAYTDWNKAIADMNKADADRSKAYADWEKADADWEKAIEPYFWDLVANPDNCVKAWR